MPQSVFVHRKSAKLNDLNLNHFLYSGELPRLFWHYISLIMAQPVQFDSLNRDCLRSSVFACAVRVHAHRRGIDTVVFVPENLD